MNKIERLIEKLCPNGVEWRPLWSVTFWDKKFNAVDREKQPKVIKYNYLLANDLKPLVVKNGNVKLLTTSTTDLYTTEEKAGDLLSEGEVVTIPWGGNPNIQYYNGKFLTADNRIATSRDRQILDNKYLYYFMENSKELIGSFYRGSGIKHPDMAKVLDLTIPVPPLEVQCEIVQILDNFANLKAELEAELAARIKQYQQYRDTLLSGDWPRVKLGEIGFVTKLAGFEFTKYVKYQETGNIIALRGLNVKHGHLVLDDVKYIDGSDLSMLERSRLEIGDMLFTYVGTVGQVALIDKNDKYYLAPNVAKIRLSDNRIKPEFLKFYFQSSQFLDVEMKKRMGSSSMDNLTMENIRKFEIPLPPLAEQERIVGILDKFDKLVNSLTEGLPAEIAARQKQYEYYRDKLLSFGKEAK